MKLTTRILAFPVFALIVAAAGCGGGSTTSTPPTTSPTTAPTTSPTAAPTTSPTTAPTTSPTSSPSSAPAATWTFSGSTATLSATSGQTASVNLPAYQSITFAAQFGAATSTGSLSLSDALNNGDVTPNTLPADNATTGALPLIYVSFYNASTTTVGFGSQTPAITVTDTSGFGTATACELDVYVKNGGSTLTWNAVATGGTISGTTATIPSVALSGGMTVDFQSGQQIVAVACH